MELAPAESDNLLEVPTSISRRRSSRCGGAGSSATSRWDNRAFQHYAVNDYDGTRVLQKSLVAGDRPYGPR